LQVLLLTDVCTGQLLPLRRGCLAHVVVVCFKFGRPFRGSHAAVGGATVVSRVVLNRR
jgi:hypothetical protein